MSGKKDTVSVKIDGKRSVFQKRLLLADLKELHQEFKKINSNNPVSFSAFSKLRPKHCVFAGGSGTHSVCVCVIHENCKLMLDALNIKEITKTMNQPIENYKDCLRLITCKDPTALCLLANCKDCPSIEDF